MRSRDGRLGHQRRAAARAPAAVAWQRRAGDPARPIASQEQFVREHNAVRQRSLKITFLEPGSEAYVFTFGLQGGQP